jgi:succinate dehydrogenase / fumarate reductase, cytochrome b subunit
MAHKQARPLSPHLTIWKWGPAMTVSILNRAMGIGLATVGVAAITWWLVALASGPEAYEAFLTCARGWIGMVVTIGLSFAFFFHLLGGLRHFVLDAGAGFELTTNRNWSWAVIAGSAMLTAIFWLVIYGKDMI